MVLADGLINIRLPFASKHR